MTMTSMNSIHHSSITNFNPGPVTTYTNATFTYSGTAGGACASSDGNIRIYTTSNCTGVIVNGVTKLTLEAGSIINDMCCDATGTKILVVGLTSTSGKGLIRYSGNLGVSWVDVDTPTFGTGITKILLCAMSSNGLLIVLFVKTSSDTILYASNDGGTSWLNTNYSVAYTMSTNRFLLLMNTDGQIVMSNYFINRGGYPWLWGWESILPPKITDAYYGGYTGVGMSPNGKNIIIGGSVTYISFNYGYTWSQISTGWAGGSCSNDGKYISIIAIGYGISMSENYGRTWKLRQVGGDPAQSFGQERYPYLCYPYTIMHSPTNSFMVIKRAAGGGGNTTAVFVSW